jgi:vacuole morphology and inheritance protein 14
MAFLGGTKIVMARWGSSRQIGMMQHSLRRSAAPCAAPHTSRTVGRQGNIHSRIGCEWCPTGGGLQQSFPLCAPDCPVQQSQRRASDAKKTSLWCNKALLICALLQSSVGYRLTNLCTAMAEASMGMTGVWIPEEKIMKNLLDSRQEARKEGGQAIERKVIEMLRSHQDAQIKQLTQWFANQHILGQVQIKNIKGGLMALSAIGLALDSRVVHYAEFLIPPVCSCFKHQNAEVRFAAIESMYNILKCGRKTPILKDHFNTIFDGLCSAICETSQPSDASARRLVSNAAAALDRLMKDLVCDSRQFNLPLFLPRLIEHLSPKPEAATASMRQFVLGWITVLDTVPEIDLVTHLDDIISGIMTMTGSHDAEIQSQATNILRDFLQQVKQIQDYPIGALIPTLVALTDYRSESSEATKEKVQSDRVVETALEWLNEFMELGGQSMLQHAGPLLKAIFKCSSKQSQAAISATAKELNEKLQAAVNSLQPKQSDTLGTEAVIEVLLENAGTKVNGEHARNLSYNWMLTLSRVKQSDFQRMVELNFDSLSLTFSQKTGDKYCSEDVLDNAIHVHAAAAQKDANFSKLLQHIVEIFERDSELFSSRATSIIIGLCKYLDPEKVYREFADIISKKTQSHSSPFAAKFIQALCYFLLTSTEPSLVSLRKLLRSFAHAPQARSFFESLFQCWCVNPVSAFSLCLLAEVYELSASIVMNFTSLATNVAFLVQAERLVQILETPSFARLRLQLLEPKLHPYLIKSLFGLLMILPQTSAFKILQNRLASVPVQSLLLLDLKPDATFAMQGASDEETSKLIEMRTYMNIFQKKMPKE